MAIEINFPKSGMGIDEGTVIAWLKGVGETVTQGEIIAEVETAKSVLEIEAPADGKLARILVDEGMTVPVNTSLGLIE